MFDVTQHLEDGLLRDVHRHPAGQEGRAPVVALHDCQRVQWETQE